MPRRLSILLVVLLAALCAASSAQALTIGIADQKPDMFTDPRFLASDLHYARRAVPWDALTSPTQTAQLDAWLDAARDAAHVNPLLSFTHSSTNRRQLPTPERLLYEFRRFRARYPWVTDYATLERGQPLRRADLPSPRARRGLLAQAARARARRAGSSPPRSSTCPT